MYVIKDGEVKPFNESSYLAQVRRLRDLAEGVLSKYHLKNYKMDFINHGENATFKVTTSKKNYLLRLHRNSYHTRTAILEELKWLARLSKTSDIPAQKPLASKEGKLIESHFVEGVKPRFCDILEWQPGRMKFQTISNNNFFNLGILIAKLHINTRDIKVHHRNYWTPEGLIGPKAKLGSILALKSVIPKDYPDLEKCRKMVLVKINQYQKRNLKKMGLIHADLHFGNLLWNKGVITPIDFDDCGFGFYAYDIAVTLYSSSRNLKSCGIKKIKSSREALLEGYSSLLNLSKEDLEILPYFILARRLAMVAWLNDRRDNPRLLEYFNKSIKIIMKDFRKALNYGPTIY